MRRQSLAEQQAAQEEARIRLMQEADAVFEDDSGSESDDNSHKLAADDVDPWTQSELSNSIDFAREKTHALLRRLLAMLLAAVALFFGTILQLFGGFRKKNW